MFTVGVVIELVDRWTGEPVDDNSDPVCIEEGKQQTFECRVRPVSRNDWRILWILDDYIVRNGTVVKTPIHKGLVQLASRYTVSNGAGTALPNSLACKVTGPNELILNAEVLLYCSGKK